MAPEVRIAQAAPVVLDIAPRPRSISLDAPWEWLAAGWQDVCRTPAVSLTYGAAFTVAAGALAFMLLRLQALPAFLPMAGGFLLLGPFLAAGLYEASRRAARGQPARLGDIVGAWLSARGQLGFFAIILLLAYLIWLQIAFLLLMLFVGSQGIPPPAAFMQELLFTPRGLGLLVSGTAIGAILASIVFAMSAVTIPLLMVRNIDAVTAARVSVAAVALNLKPMALWAALIAVIMAAGFATLLVGLVVAFPLIGHATWHAYEDILGPSDRDK